MQPIPKKKERKKGRRKRKEKQIGGNNLFFQRLKLPYFSEIHTFRLVHFSFFPIIIINAIRQYKFVNDLNNDKIIKRYIYICIGSIFLKIKIVDSQANESNELELTGECFSIFFFLIEFYYYIIPIDLGIFFLSPFFHLSPRLSK